MLCPNCGSSMTLVKQDITHGDDGTHYDRDQYRCSYDDWWVAVESPVEEDG